MSTEKIRKCIVTLAGCHQGQRKKGVQYGYTAFLSPLFRSAGKTIKPFYNDFRSDKYYKDPVYGSHIMGNNVVKVIKDNTSDKDRQFTSMVTLGGDHTISYGSIVAAMKTFENVKVLWVDAHPDTHTPCSSLSGNCHGMPVSFLLGFSKMMEVPTQPHLNVKNLVYIGLRSIDEHEQALIDEHDIKCYSAEDVKTKGINKVLSEIGTYWNVSEEKTDSKIHISLDIDSIDPEFTPATGTPVPNGITPDDVKSIMKFANRCSVGGAANIDVTEVNPELSDVEGACKTYSVCEDLLSYYFSSYKD